MTFSYKSKRPTGAIWTPTKRGNKFHALAPSALWIFYVSFSTLLNVWKRHENMLCHSLILFAFAPTASVANNNFQCIVFAYSLFRIQNEKKPRASATAVENLYTFHYGCYFRKLLFENSFYSQSKFLRTSF